MQQKEKEVTNNANTPGTLHLQLPCALLLLFSYPGVSTHTFHFPCWTQLSTSRFVPSLSHLVVCQLVEPWSCSAGLTNPPGTTGSGDSPGARSPPGSSPKLNQTLDVFDSGEICLLFWDRRYLFIIYVSTLVVLFETCGSRFPQSSRYLNNSNVVAKEPSPDGSSDDPSVIGQRGMPCGCCSIIPAHGRGCSASSGSFSWTLSFSSSRGAGTALLSRISLVRSSTRQQISCSCWGDKVCCCACSSHAPARPQGVCNIREFNPQTYVCNRAVLSSPAYTHVCRQGFPTKIFNTKKTFSQTFFLVFFSSYMAKT